MSDNENKDPQKTPNKVNFNSYWIYGIIILVILGINMSVMMNNSTKNITYTEFEEKVAGNKVERVDVINKQIAHVYLTPDALKTDMPDYQESSYAVNQPQYQFEIGDMAFFLEKMQELKESGYAVPYKMETKTNWLAPIMSWLLPLFILVAIWLFIMKKVSGGGGPGGGQIFNIGKSKATLFDNKDSKVNVTFADVAGLNEAKEEVMEVVDFLKNPKKYTALGGKIPKGVLLVGPPGTGKTLLAKAVAGEAEVPFFSISGSDFVEMFVGVGASRVRDLFKQAREKAPCIIFIDEIDAIGRARGKGAVQGGNDERENTLNQLLVEMDGFSTDKGVILMAATNRPDILDSALMRPGRFDRQIGIDRPDLKGREAIFKVHLKNIKRSETMSPYELAEMTPGFAGAEIANVCNEAALIAARRGKTEVDMNDFNYALDRVIGGLEKKTKIITPAEKKVIAYHEAGHAAVSWLLEYASPLVKVTIVPRGRSLGAAWYLPEERQITTSEQMLDEMCATMGGRAAEKVVFDNISTGALSDLEKVTKQAKAMVTIYGLSEEIGNITYYDSQGQNDYAMSKPYSEETAVIIDKEISKIIDQQYDRAQALLEEKNKELHLLAAALLDKEVLTKADVARLIGDSPFEDKNKPMVSNQPKVPENPSIEVPSPDEIV